MLKLFNILLAMLVTARTEERTTVDPCDNSNDSGLGFDHLDFQLAARSTQSLADQEVCGMLLPHSTSNDLHHIAWEIIKL